jgi:hypothetical protein
LHEKQQLITDHEIYHNGTTAPYIADKVTELIVDDSAPISNRLGHYDSHNKSNVCVNNTFELLLDSDFDIENKQIYLPQCETFHLLDDTLKINPRCETTQLFDEDNDLPCEPNTCPWYIDDVPRTLEPLEPVSRTLHDTIQKALNEPINLKEDECNEIMIQTDLGHE